MWRYSILNNTWTYISGDKSRNTPLNIIMPHPGAISKHSMILLDNYAYVFGGYGIDINSNLGTINTIFNKRLFKRFVEI